MRHVRMSRGGAFTLVELLIVIAIIAVLAAILLPAIAHAHEQARIIRCTSNVATLAKAYLMYAGDNQGRLVSSNTWSIPPDPPVPGGDLGGIPSFRNPPSFFWGWVEGGHQPPPDNSPSIAQGKLWPYLKAYEVYKCPGNSLPTFDHHYSINGMLAGESIPTNFGRTYLTVSEVETHANSAGVFVFVEGWDYREYLIRSFKTNSYPSRTFVDFPANYHDGGTTLAFLDGHAIFYKYVDGKTSAPPYDAAYGFVTNDVPQFEAWNGGPVPPGYTQ